MAAKIQMILKSTNFLSYLFRARFVTQFFTERGVGRAQYDQIARLFAEHLGQKEQLKNLPNSIKNYESRIKILQKY